MVFYENFNHNVLKLDVHNGSDCFLLGSKQSWPKHHTQISNSHQVLLVVICNSAKQKQCKKWVIGIIRMETPSPPHGWHQPYGSVCVSDTPGELLEGSAMWKSTTLTIVLLEAPQPQELTNPIKPQRCPGHRVSCCKPLPGKHLESLMLETLLKTNCWTSDTRCSPAEQVT